MYHPCNPAAWFAMLVYKNGSLTREGVRDRRARGSWEAFSKYGVALCFYTISVEDGS